MWEKLKEERSGAYDLCFFGNNERIRRKNRTAKEDDNMLDRTSLILTIIGAINWLLVGLFQFDLVAYFCGGQTATLSRIIYTVVGIAGLWCISLLFRERTREPHEARVNG